MTKKCVWLNCTNDADPAREGSGPFDDDLCAYHDEIQQDDALVAAYDNDTTTKEKA